MFSLCFSDETQPNKFAIHLIMYQYSHLLLQLNQEYCNGLGAGHSWNKRLPEVKARGHLFQEHPTLRALHDIKALAEICSHQVSLEKMTKKMRHFAWPFCGEKALLDNMPFRYATNFMRVLYVPKCCIKCHKLLSQILNLIIEPNHLVKPNSNPCLQSMSNGDGKMPALYQGLCFNQSKPQTQPLCVLGGGVLFHLIFKNKSSPFHDQDFHTYTPLCRFFVLKIWKPTSNFVLILILIFLINFNLKKKLSR